MNMLSVGQQEKSVWKTGYPADQPDSGCTIISGYINYAPTIAAVHMCKYLVLDYTV